MKRLTLGWAMRLLLLAAPILLGGPAGAAVWHNVDITGYGQPLALRMTDATTGKAVSEREFRGDIVLLYLGYTQCPDVCPLTLQNVAEVFRRLGKRAANVRLLFVTVDPNRDTLPILKQYTSAFSPDFVGLRGDANEIASLARRYRLAYSVTPASNGQPYRVTHSSAIYVFDREGNAKLLIDTMASSTPDIAGTAQDLSKLLQEPEKPGLLSRLGAMF